ncbi:tetratricopeptide repeat protein, partial [bacterium]|nr:tetratricopeptide repeat protein [bacterium]
MNWKTLILLVFIFLTACVTPTPADIFTTKGTDAIKQNKQKEALTYFEEALKLDADHYVARFNAGEIYNSQGNQEKAIEYFTKITEIRTFSDKLRRYKKNAFFNIAAIRLGQKRYNEALVAAIQGGSDAYDKIRKPLLDRLKKSGFKYDLDVHTTSELHIPYPPNQTADDILVVINLSLDEKGNVLFYR